MAEELKLKDASFIELSKAIAEKAEEVVIITNNGTTTLKGDDLLRLIALTDNAKDKMKAMYNKAIQKEKLNLSVPDPANPGKFKVM